MRSNDVDHLNMVLSIWELSTTKSKIVLLVWTEFLPSLGLDKNILLNRLGKNLLFLQTFPL